MLNIIAVIITIVLTSFYFFPFEFTFLPGINTKMAMAGVGLVSLGIQLAKNNKTTINKDFFVLSVIAIIIGIISFFTASYNETRDYSFATYFISMWVWMGGAYSLYLWMRKIHGNVTVRLMCNYLIAVCVLQCIIALIMDMHAPLKQFVDSFLGGEDAFMGKAEGRLYGIGAALDVAGFRFAAVLVMISYLCMNTEKLMTKYTAFWYILSFLIIGIIGSMIGRSASIGIGVALLYFLYSSLTTKENEKENRSIFWKWTTLVLVIILPLVVVFYNTNPDFRENLRFGFEGFFSLWEKGYWETNSTDILMNHMVVFPETLKTWIIGDGYAANPSSLDPYYIGPDFHGFYMATDIGYIRFLFYFGIIGTLGLIVFITKAAMSCVSRFPHYKMMFLLLLLLNLVEWVKVSTDIFVVFALFLCISFEEDMKDREKETLELESGQ